MTPVSEFTGAGDASVGQNACVLTLGTGIHCGSVQALNATVDLGGTVVNGLVQANVCTESPSDGAPLFSGGTVLGILAFGGDCASGAESFFQPIAEILRAYGLSLD